MNRLLPTSLAVMLAANTALLAQTTAQQPQQPQRPKPGTIIDTPSGGRIIDSAPGYGRAEVVVGDINAAMLEVGRDRLTDRGLVIEGASR